MKEQVTSFDVFVLAKELDELLTSSRIDKIYQTGEKDISLNTYVSGQGQKELVFNSGYVCVTKYSRKKPERATAFAMLMRKLLKGAFIRGVKQHEFDRILNFEIEKKETKYTLILELFSTGNVILCDSEGIIKAILERQKWKDRTLGANKPYAYPPSRQNPAETPAEEVVSILQGSEKSLVATLAFDISLGGLYAEELCLKSGIDKNKTANELTEKELKKISGAFDKMMAKLKEAKIKPMIVLDARGSNTDVVPFAMLSHKGMKTKKFGSFNDAVDDYFSRKQHSESLEKAESAHEKRMKKTERIRDSQLKTIERLKKDETDSKKKGDLIYQNAMQISDIVSAIQKARESGLSDEEILERFDYGKKKGMKKAGIVKGLKKNELVLELD